MSLTNAAETDLLELLFNNLDWPNIGDASGLQGSAAPGNFYISLHTSDPGETGNQSTNEVSYTGYGRVAVARSSGGFTITGGNCANTAAVTFGECTAGSATAAYFGIGTAATGSGNLIASGQLTQSLNITTGVIPKFNAGDLDINAE